MGRGILAPSIHVHRWFYEAQNGTEGFIRAISVSAIKTGQIESVLSAQFYQAAG